MCVCVCVCVRACVHQCVHACACVCAPVCACMCVCVCVHQCVHACACVCVCIYACVCVSRPEVVSCKNSVSPNPRVRFPARLPIQLYIRGPIHSAQWKHLPLVICPLTRLALPLSLPWCCQRQPTLPHSKAHIHTTKSPSPTTHKHMHFGWIRFLCSSMQPSSSGRAPDPPEQRATIHQVHCGGGEGRKAPLS